MAKMREVVQMYNDTPLQRHTEGADDNDILDISRAFGILKQHLFKLCCVGLLALVVSYLFVSQIEPSYRATSTLEIADSQANTVSIESVVGIDTSKQEYFQTQYEILRSRQLAKRVVDKLGLINHPEFTSQPSLYRRWLPEEWLIGVDNTIALARSAFGGETVVDSKVQQQREVEQVYSEFSQRLSISPVRKTRLVRISFDSSDPSLAALISNTLGEEYIEQNLELRLLATQNASGVLGTRLEELRSDLEQSQGALDEFLTRENLLDTGNIDDLVNSELSGLTRQLAEARDRRMAAEALIAVAGSNASLSRLSSLPEINAHPQIRDIRQAQIAAEQKVNELSERYGPKHDKMIQAQAELQAVKSRGYQVVRELNAGLKDELSTSYQQERNLESALEAKKQEFQSVTVKRNEFESLKRDVESNRNLYDLFLTRQKETSATVGVTTAHARFTDYASEPVYPFGPDKMRWSLLGMIVVMGTVAMSLLWKESHRATFAFAREFETRVGIQPLVSIPILKHRHLDKGMTSSSDYRDKRHVLFSEAFRSVRTSIQMMEPWKNKSVMAVSSSIPDEGKTTVSMNLAIAFARVDSTILVESDLRHPSLAKRFGFPKETKGLGHYLLMGADLSECLHQDPITGVWLMPAGMRCPNPQECLSLPRFKQLVALLSQKASRVIFDTPPLIPLSDGLIVAQQCQSVLLVVKANQTRKGQFTFCMSKLTSYEIDIAGVVLNGVKGKPGFSYPAYQHYGSYLHDDTKEDVA